MDTKISQVEAIHTISHVEAKIDYYTVMLYGCSLGVLLRRFNVWRTECFEDFLLSAKDSQFLSQSVVIFKLPFGSLAIPVDELGCSAELFRESVPEDVSDDDLAYQISRRCVSRILDKRIDRVRFNSSGVQLDNMRALGFSPEEMFTSFEFWCSSFHDACGDSRPPIANKFRVSRCDFAFDLVNDPLITGSYLEEVLKEFSGYKAAGIKRLCHGKPGGLTYEPQLGENIRCLYIGKGEKTIERGSGSTTPEFIRIYDKKLEVGVKQYKTLDSSLWPDDEPHQGVRDWVRIELQCRNNVAEGFLFSLQNVTPAEKFQRVMKHIADRYLVKTERGADTVQSLRKIFDVTLSQNLHFIQLDTLPFRVPLRCTGVTAVDSFLSKYEVSLIKACFLYGGPQILEHLNQRLLLFRSSSDLIHQRKSLKINKGITEIALECGVNVEDLPGYGPDGLLETQFDPLLSRQRPIPVPASSGEVLEQIAIDFSGGV